MLPPGLLVVTPWFVRILMPLLISSISFVRADQVYVALGHETLVIVSMQYVLADGGTHT